MENVYGIGTANRYALFLDEDADPLDILKQSEALAATAKTKKIEEASKPAVKGKVKKEEPNTKNEAGELTLFSVQLFLTLLAQLCRKASTLSVCFGNESKAASKGVLPGCQF